MREYADTKPDSDEAAEVLATVKYLSALNKIFERTLLGTKTRIFMADGTAIQRLDEGFSYFKEWSENLRSLGVFGSGVDSSHFISWQVCINSAIIIQMISKLMWLIKKPLCTQRIRYGRHSINFGHCLFLQTWDLLRIMIYGFKGLCERFISTHPGHHINPKRVNGSGVETLFGQLKHTTSGNLTGHTYETAKATLLTKRQVQSGKKKDDYRDTPLNIRQASMQRKT